jgi:MFS family permease
MGSFVRTEGRPHYYLVLLLISNVCAGASWGILTPTIIASCLGRGSSTLVIGVLTSIWALPFLIAAPIYTRIVGRVSAKPALLVGMSADVISVWLGVDHTANCRRGSARAFFTDHRSLAQPLLH